MFKESASQQGKKTSLGKVTVTYILEIFFKMPNLKISFFQAICQIIAMACSKNAHLK